MEIDRALIDQIANLTRLGLTDDEAAGLQSHLQRMLDHVEKLSEIDTSDVDPSAGPGTSTGHSVFRADEPKPSLPLADALANAPEMADDGFKVPRVIGAGS